MQDKPYQLLLHPDTWQKTETYLTELRAESWRNCGARLCATLADTELARLSTEQFIENLFATKQPQIFAESAVRGDGTDWNAKELSILGDLGIAVRVNVYDDGRHRHPRVHDRPFPATLLYTPGALLRNGTGHMPADWEEVTRNGELDLPGYCALYERRLLPLLLHANAEAAAEGRDALVTLPGLGCGQFAGPFGGRLGEALKLALIALLQRHGHKLPNVRALYYDPFAECRNERHPFGNLSLLVRPLMQGNQLKPQLCPPAAYAEDGDDFADCRLFSMVAWDHVSWPGNDFYIGSRATDDGVKAAATSSMAAVTGIEGRYNPVRHTYDPPEPYRTWGELVADHRLRLSILNDLRVLPG